MSQYNRVKRMINKYSKLRSGESPAINVKSLNIVYKRADRRLRQFYEKEMQDYFDAIDTNKIKPGESILKKELLDISFNESSANERVTKGSL